MQKIRIGQGIDYHQLVSERDFFLGGIQIPHYKGALGHSDADVLLHAICDALLGALALGDIGFHFPNTDERYKDIDSKILLKHCFDLIKSNQYFVGNLDCTILLEKPKIMKYAPEMKKIISEILKINENDVSIKATTTETLGFVGEEKGIIAYATVLLFLEN